MRKQVRLFYSGRVQGIGFRYTVLGIARQQKVYGWIKNLDDGRVEILAQASEDVLKNFLQEINQRFFGYIKDLSTEWLPANGELSDFQVMF
jgi:acylphosphatase